MPRNNYSPFIGRAYEPPHGCLRLVEAVYREVYGINLGSLDSGFAANDGTALYRLLDRLTFQTQDPEEGDIILLRSNPWHVGVYIQPGEMLHSYQGGAGCIERYNDLNWRARVEGFYRYAG